MHNFINLLDAWKKFCIPGQIKADKALTGWFLMVIKRQKKEYSVLYIPTFNLPWDGKLIKKGERRKEKGKEGKGEKNKRKEMAND